MPFPLARRAVDLRERMDDPACDERRLIKTFRHFAVINRLFSGWRAIYRSEIRPSLARLHAPGRLLDVGCGGGDIPWRLWRWARADGLALQVTAIDTDERAIRFAQRREWPAEFRFRRAALRDLAAESESFDLVISNNHLHHLDPGELSALFDDASRLARRLVVFNDIRRSPVACVLYALAVGPWLHGSFVLPDGLASIRRSFTRPELRAVAPPDWEVRTRFPCRLLLIHRR